MKKTCEQIKKGSELGQSSELGSAWQHIDNITDIGSEAITSLHPSVVFVQDESVRNKRYLPCRTVGVSIMNAWARAPFPNPFLSLIYPGVNWREQCAPFTGSTEWFPFFGKALSTQQREQRMNMPVERKGLSLAIGY
ncbi:hypothetical protein GPALN_003330 [Globodera pallida]|nr:hypothetical protein GPALN_003330 [Globodera pallida]